MVTRELFSSGAVVTSAKKVVLYGAGSVGRDVCAVLTGHGIGVECILDRRATNRDDFRGVPIRTPDGFESDARARAATPLVLTVFNRDVDVPALARTMHDLGFAQVVSFPELHASFAAELGDRFWLTDRATIERHDAAIAEVDRLWADDDSRRIYRGLIALRRGGKFDESIEPRTGQYFPDDLPGWPGRSPLRFVDCGAYRGDTLQLILDKGIELEASALFEPDLDNFAGLVEFVRSERDRIRGSAQLWPCAVSDRSGTVRFQTGAGEASVISDGGDTQVTAVALDDVLSGWRPTLIKMDIEGAELAALLGARRTLTESRPALAVCVYHRPDHLWSIPLSLSHAIETEGYRYYLRVHGYNGLEAVLYALPTSYEVQL